MASSTPLLGDVRRLYDGQLLPDALAYTLRHVDALFPTREVAAAAAQTLPARPMDWSGLRFQACVFETYALGADDTSRFTSMSMAKSVAATLVGVAIHEGLIENLDDPLPRYLPELAASAYAGVTIRQLLWMRSGVGWDETYTDPTSNRRQMLDAQLAQQPGAILRLMARLPRVAPPGSRFNYSTGETHLVGALLRQATGMPAAQYLSERIWQPCGMEASAQWWLESPDGLEVAGSGLSARLRDFARFGQYMLAVGVVNGAPTLPAGFVGEATRAAARRPDEPPYGYMWWPVDVAQFGAVHEGAYLAIGIFGQYLYMHPTQRVVIAQAAALPKPRFANPYPVEDFFGAVVQHLAAAG
jgi:CubicO group peptidase (beta-lactamase class C family)